ncbi:MAG: 3-dehydroquinate synthase family protein [Planctomycetota bacterium]
MDRRYELTRISTTRIVIGAGVEARLPALVGELDSDGVVVLHDAALPELAARIARALGTPARLSIPGGEATKRLTTVGDLARSVRLAGASRSTALVAVGGGTICDLVGMLAAVLLRGVPFVACPTTTLAMCDAAIGGKNGVDHDGRKNELGTIRQPNLIAADVEWLARLPDELFREGLVEVVKKAAVLDAARFARLEQLAPALAARDAAALSEAIEMAVAMKMAIVQEDESDHGRRRSLNFGHTIGHAIESSAEGKLRHGTCVALGMLLECRAAGVAADVQSRLAAVLAKLGLPKAVPPALAHATSLWRMARTDKKVARGNVPMCVPRALGECVEVELTEDALAAALRDA